MQPIEDDMSFSQLKAGESLLEIHLKVKTQTLNPNEVKLIFLEVLISVALTPPGCYLHPSRAAHYGGHSSRSQ